MAGINLAKEIEVKMYFVARSNEPVAEINFDLIKMQKAVSGGSIRPPAGLSREERRKWIQENAGRCNA